MSTGAACQGAEQGHGEFPVGNSPESATPKIPGRIPGYYRILVENFQEFQKFSILVNFCFE